MHRKKKKKMFQVPGNITSTLCVNKKNVSFVKKYTSYFSMCCLFLKRVKRYVLFLCVYFTNDSCN